MLLVEHKVALNLPDGNSFKSNALASEMIDYETFLGYKKAFQGLLDEEDGSDEDPQYISKKAFDKLDGNDIIKKIAFVFLTKEKGDKDRISVAMLGIDENQKFVYEKELFIFNKAFESSRDEENINRKIGKGKSEKMKDWYKERRIREFKLKYSPIYDMGVWHDQNYFKNWLQSVDEYAEVHFGVQQPNNFQVVMLVSDKSLKSNPPQPGTMYALDKGNGCCPEQ